MTHPPQSKPINRKLQGRPKLPAGQGLGRGIPVRLRNADRLAIEQAADAAGETLAEWMRTAAMMRLRRDTA